MPSVRAYDPAFAYELAAIVRDGIERMYVQGEDVFYYVTLYNENYPMPPMPEGVDDGHRPRPVPVRRGAGWRGRQGRPGAPRRQRLDPPAGPRGAAILAEQFDVAAEVYSAPSFQQLRRDATRGRALEPAPPGREPPGAVRQQVLGPDGGPIVAASDWLKAIPDLVRPWLPDATITLGTDGFGRSDTRESLRALFEIDGPSIAAAALTGLARAGGMPPKKAAKAIRDLGIDPDKIDPLAL